ncbi:MAG: phosphoribosylformylglycinamidine cyclo-ligase [bacterium]
MDYQSSGVNIQAGNKAVDSIKAQVESTHNAEVLGGLGGFAAAYDISQLQYKEPVIVSCTDGVGTKLHIAIQENKLATVGIDLVAMSVNDLLCTGANPLFFLDYYACHQLEPEQVKEVVKGICEGCKQSALALVGGEMAEMGSMYKKNDFDLAGFACGIVEKSKLLKGSHINEGDYLYALPSAGFHSNGYSLIRNVLETYPEAKNKIGLEALLEPTRIYTTQCKKLLKQFPSIVAFAHITGGGLNENIQRLLNDGLKVDIDKKKIRVLECFRTLQKIGKIHEEEMWKVFNMGVGMVIISSEKLPDDRDYYPIGRIAKG